MAAFWPRSIPSTQGPTRSGASATSIRSHVPASSNIDRSVSAVPVFSRSAQNAAISHGSRFAFAASLRIRASRCRLYGEGKVSLARAARDAGVSLWEMMDFARSRKVPAQYELEDLRRDLETISGGLNTRGTT